MKPGGGAAGTREPAPRFSLRLVQVAGAVLVLGLVGSLLAFAFVTQEDEDAAPPSPTTIPQPGDPILVEGALRPSDPAAGAFTIDLPAGWIEVTPTKEGLDAFVEARVDEPGAGPVTQLVQRLRPAILGDEAPVLGPVPLDPDERDREVAAVVVPAAGSGYVMVSTVPARGASIDEVKVAVQSELAPASATTYVDEVVGGSNGFAVTVPGGSDAAPADVVHHLTVVNDVLFVLTATGSAPVDLNLEVEFDVPEAPTDRSETFALHPDYPETVVSVGVPGSWVAPPLAQDEYPAYVDAVAGSGDEGLGRFLESLEASIAAAGAAEASGTAGAVAPRFLAVEPSGRAYVMVSSGDVGAATLDQVRDAFVESNATAEVTEVEEAVAGRPGLVATATDDRGVVVTTSLALAGPLLVTVVAAGEGSAAIVDGLTIDGVPPTPVTTTPLVSEPAATLPPPVVTTPPPTAVAPPTTAPPTQQVVRIPIGPEGGPTLSFVFPEGWTQVPSDPDGFRRFRAEQRIAGHAPLAALLDDIEPLLIFELPDLPFDLGIVLPEAVFIGAADDASAFVGVQFSAAGDRTAEGIAREAAAAAREQGRDLAYAPVRVGGVEGYRLTETRGGRVFEQDLFVVDDIAVSVLHGPDLPDELLDSMAVG